MKNIPKNIWIEISPKNLWRYIKNYPTTSEENYLPNNPLRETLYQTNFEKKSLPNKFPQQKPSRDISLPKNLKKHLNKQKHLKRLSLQKKLKRTISQKKPLKRNLYHSLQRNPYQTNFRRNLYQRRTMPTKRSWDKSLRKNIWREISNKNSKKHLHQKIKTHEIRWKTYFLIFHQLRFFSYPLILLVSKRAKIGIDFLQRLNFSIWICMWTCIWICIFLCWVDLSKSNQKINRNHGQNQFQQANNDIPMTKSKHQCQFQKTDANPIKK